MLHHLFDPTTWLGAVVIAVFYLGLALFGMRLIRAWKKRIIDHSLRVDKTTANFVSQLAQLLCFLIVLILYAHTIPALDKFGTALLTSAGVLSIVLGIAAQNTLGNLIAGIALLFYRPFGIGDVLVLFLPTGKESGTVKEFGLGYTKLITEEGRWIIAPNIFIISSVLIKH